MEKLPQVKLFVPQLSDEVEPFDHCDDSFIEKEKQCYKNVIIIIWYGMSDPFYRLSYNNYNPQLCTKGIPKKVIKISLFPHKKEAHFPHKYIS